MPGFGCGIKTAIQKACLMYSLIPEFLGFNAASQYKVKKY